jgi:hypothetical protein
MATSRPPSYPGDDGYAWSGGAAAARNYQVGTDVVNGSSPGESSTVGGGPTSFSRNGVARKYVGVGRGYRRERGSAVAPPGEMRPVSMIPEEDTLYSIPYDAVR